MVGVKSTYSLAIVYLKLIGCRDVPPLKERTGMDNEKNIN